MNRAGRLEELLAALLRYGSWSASAAIGLGYALALIGSHAHSWNPPVLFNMRIVTCGNRVVYSASHPSRFVDVPCFHS